MLQRLGRQIHQGTKHPNDWARVTSMGGFKEVGRSSMLLQTPNSRVLLDCGVNVAASDNKNAFPYLNVPEFSIEELDAVIIHTLTWITVDLCHTFIIMDMKVRFTVQLQQEI